MFRSSDILADLFPHLKDSLTETPEKKHTTIRTAHDDSMPVPSGSGSALPAERTAEAENRPPAHTVFSAQEKPFPAKKPSVHDTPPLTEEEETILSLLRRGPVSQDELLHAALEESPVWNSASVSAVLMILEVKKLAHRRRDSRYEAVS